MTLQDDLERIGVACRNVEERTGYDYSSYYQRVCKQVEVFQAVYNASLEWQNDDSYSHELNQAINYAKKVVG